MGYAEQDSIKPGLMFKTPSGLVVKTSGKSLFIESHKLNVHEVEIVEGPNKGSKFLHNLDYAKPM